MGTVDRLVPLLCFRVHGMVLPLEVGSCPLFCLITCQGEIEVEDTGQWSAAGYRPIAGSHFTHSVDTRA